MVWRLVRIELPTTRRIALRRRGDRRLWPAAARAGEQRDMTLHSPFVVRGETKPNDFLDEMGERLRSIAEALSDLRTKHKAYPRAELARMIGQLEAEIADRGQTASAARWHASLPALPRARRQANRRLGKRFVFEAIVVIVAYWFR
jgi:hypothetical protein